MKTKARPSLTDRLKTPTDSSKRWRISVDLDTVPDVKEMLIAAIQVTGLSISDLMIMSLERQLPALVEELLREREKGLADFLKRFPKHPAASSAAEPGKIGKATEQQAGQLSGKIAKDKSNT